MNNQFLETVERLENGKKLSLQEFDILVRNRNSETFTFLREKAEALRRLYYGKTVYLRGLIEISNICSCDCYYCGIRASNKNADRYRLLPEQIYACCEQGHAAGYRTFVLQGGEDPWFTDECLEEILKHIKEKYPDCAVTLSVGERSRDSYQRLFDAGADRYLLRFETANPEHYNQLHPANTTLENRLRCLKDLKEIGYAVGTGFLVGAPYEKEEYLAHNLFLLQQIEPHMVGIGPFLPQKDTPFRNEAAGDFDKTLYLLAIIRVMLPNVLLPATTAINTLRKNGRGEAIKTGANVIMPNLSPPDMRAKYALYDGKVSTGSESAEGWRETEEEMKKIEYCVVSARGDRAEKKL